MQAFLVCVDISDTHKIYEQRISRGRLPSIKRQASTLHGADPGETYSRVAAQLARFGRYGTQGLPSTRFRRIRLDRDLVGLVAENDITNRNPTRDARKSFGQLPLSFAYRRVRTRFRTACPSTIFPYCSNIS